MESIPKSDLESILKKSWNHALLNFDVCLEREQPFARFWHGALYTIKSQCDYFGIESFFQGTFIDLIEERHKRADRVKLRINIMKWLNNEFIKLSKVAKALWGVNTSTTRCWLARKMKDGSFSFEELMKLEKIRQDLKKNL